MTQKPEQLPDSIPGTKIHPESSATFMQRFADLRDRFLELFGIEKHVEPKQHPVNIRVYSGDKLDVQTDVTVRRTVEEMISLPSATGKLGEVETLERRHHY